MKTKLILITTALLIFGWDLAQAQFTGGIGRGDSMGRLGEVTDPGDTYAIELQFPQNGPQNNQINVPRNGYGYIYYQIVSDEGPFNDPDGFEVGLLDNINQISYSANAWFIDDNLIQIQVPYSYLSNESAVNFELENSFTVAGDIFIIEGQTMLFTANPVEQPWQRTWSVFASGSAGVSGTVGSVGFGPSVALAKLSVKGTGGVGLDIQLDHLENLILTRRMELGVGVGVEVPSVNPGFEPPNIMIGFGAQLMSKGLLGQSVSFSGLNLDPDVRRMAQSGFLLETISLAGVGVTPIFGPFLRATIQSINSAGNIDQFFEPALLSDYRGAGLEGTLTGGLNIKLGPINLNAGTASGGFGLQARDINYYNNQLPTSLSQYHLNSIRNTTAGRGFDIKVAQTLELSAYEWNIKFVDGALGGQSLFSASTSTETGYRVRFSPINEVETFGFWLADGADVELLSPNWSFYTSTHVDFPGTYASALAALGNPFSGLVESSIPIPVGNQMVTAVNETYHALFDHIDSEPAVIQTSKRYGRGYQTGFGITLDFAAGVGGGVSFGANFQLFDEIQFNQLVSEVYAAGANFLIESNSFQDQMQEADLTFVMNELFSGVAPLVQTALLSFLNSISEGINAGINFILDGISNVGSFVGNLSGSLSLSGIMNSTTYSPGTPTVVQRSFELPEIRNAYISHNVARQQRLNDGTIRLQEVESELFIISNVMKLSFIPEGSNEPLAELPEEVTLSMVIYEEDLVNNFFSAEDKEAVRIYFFDPNESVWIDFGGVLDADTLRVGITLLGEYALGIEINRMDDTTPPSIKDFGPAQGSVHASFPELFAVIEDDVHGTGINLANTFMILNGDTLSYVFRPDQDRISFTEPDDAPFDGGEYELKFHISDFAGNVTEKTVNFTYEGTSTEPVEAPVEFRLSQNYPNPFNPQTVIPFTVGEATHVQINIYDVLGRYVATVFNEFVSPGTYSVIWNINDTGRNLSSGVYFYQMRAGDFNEVRKMLLVK